MVNAVHPLHPSHLILRLECFGNTLALGHPGHELVEHGFRLPINVGEIGVQSAACFQLQIQCAPVLLEKSQVALSPDVDGRHFLHGQTREVIVAPALVPQAVALFLNILFHTYVIISAARKYAVKTAYLACKHAR